MNLQFHLKSFHFHHIKFPQQNARRRCMRLFWACASEIAYALSFQISKINYLAPNRQLAVIAPQQRQFLRWMNLVKWSTDKPPAKSSARNRFLKAIFVAIIRCI